MPQTCEVSTGCVSRLHGWIPCKRKQCQVGPLPDMPVSLTRCGRLSARQVPVLRGQVVYSAWRLLGLSADAPLGVRVLPLPALRVVGWLVTSVQIRCTPHSGSARLPHCRNQEPIWLSAPESRNECPNAFEQLLEQSKPMSAPTF